MPDQLKSLEVFCRVGRLASFSAAASELGLSQSMVSKHISSLEKRLGVRLIDRTTRQVRLTSAGTSFLTSCNKIIDALSEAEASLNGERNIGLLGTLRLHAPIFLAAEYILPAVFSLQRDHPNVSAIVDASDRIVNPVQEYFDVAFTVDLRLENVDVTELCRTERVLAASPSYLDAHGTPATVEALRRHNCIALNQSTQLGKSYWNFGEHREMTFEFEGKLVFNNELAIMHAAIAGMGVVYLPALFLRPALEAGTLCRIDLRDISPSLVRIYATRPVGQPASKPLEHILSLVETRLRRHTPTFRAVPLP